MTNLIAKGVRLSLAVLMSFYTVFLSAQPEEESIYSDQAYDPVDNPTWYESPYLWIGLIAVLAILLLFLRSKSRRSRKFMEPGKEE